MAAITAALIKQVREDTGAGMLDVKKALTEAEGDVARAKEIIRAKGAELRDRLRGQDPEVRRVHRGSSRLRRGRRRQLR